MSRRNCKEKKEKERKEMERKSKSWKKTLSIALLRGFISISVFAASISEGSVPPLGRHQDHPDFTAIYDYIRYDTVGARWSGVAAVSQSDFYDSAYGIRHYSGYSVRMARWKDGSLRLLNGERQISLPLRWHPGSRINVDNLKRGIYRGASGGGYWEAKLVECNESDPEAVGVAGHLGVIVTQTYRAVQDEWIEDKPWIDGGEYNEQDPGSIGHYIKLYPLPAVPNQVDGEGKEVTIWLESARMDGNADDADGDNSTPDPAPVSAPDPEPRPDPILPDSFNPTPHGASPLT
jgi:hypothetical protein